MRHQLIIAATGATGTRGDGHQGRVGQGIVHAPLSDVPGVVVMGGVHEHGVGDSRFEDGVCWVGQEAGHWVSAVLVDQPALLSGIGGTQSL